jgi:hypothetical protein
MSAFDPLRTFPRGTMKPLPLETPLSPASTKISLVSVLSIAIVSSMKMVERRCKLGLLPVHEVGAQSEWRDLQHGHVGVPQRDAPGSMVTDRPGCGVRWTRNRISATAGTFHGSVV